MVIIVIWFVLLSTGLEMTTSTATEKPLSTVYDYFAGQGINSGLVADTPGFFKLNGRDLRIISGAMHYFRVHPALWRDRLKKLRAAGLNTIETYVPWNLHEPVIGQFDFGSGGNEFSPFLNLRGFIQMAQEEDLLVLIRPGPYICSEWDFGGLPSWLLRDPEMKVRSSYEPYLTYVSAYFDQLLPQIVDLQFTQGGPIIGIQIENEYGSFTPIDKTYLTHIKDLYDRHGLTVLQFTSDGASNGVKGALPEEGVLMTVNFQSDPKKNLDKLIKIQPGRPTMVMEFWSGWFDHWFEKHHTISLQNFTSWFEGILTHSNSSVNLYMFHGGTNFGFMAGANRLDAKPYYGPDVTSYDYNAPLSESGDYTDKYYKTMELIRKYEVPRLYHPPMPEPSSKVALDSVNVTQFLTFRDLLTQLPQSAKFLSKTLKSMESLNMNNGSGQSYGYIAYETMVDFKGLQGTLTVNSPVRDFGIVLLDDQIVGNVRDYWMSTNKTFNLSTTSSGPHRLTILVENMGRINFGNDKDFLQNKGLTGKILFNGRRLAGFTLYALEFKETWIKTLEDWRVVAEGDSCTEAISAPALFQTQFRLEGPLTDTFLVMKNWHKGIVFMNGFNLGRYFAAGPQESLYLPAPFLKIGENLITIFEQLEVPCGGQVQFSDVPLLGK